MPRHARAGYPWYRIKAIAAIRRVLTPELAPILTSDANAVERLDDKVAKLEAKQALMKATNRIVRSKKHDSEKIAALVALGHSKALAVELLEPDVFGRPGFADFELKNNNARIRAAKARTESVTEAQAKPTVSMTRTRARIEDAPADNRVRIFFEGMPERDVRDRLKRNGFRWTPSLGCWQAYRNLKALSIAAQEAGVS